MSFTAATSGFFVGMDADAVTAIRDQLRTAVMQMVGGRKVAQVQYQQGEGGKMVRYDPGNLEAARRMLNEANALLGLASGRRAIGVGFL